MACKLQFSLRWMFAAVAVVALIAAEAVAFPGWVAAILGFVITSLMVPALVVGVVYSRGCARAFCVGAVAWLAVNRWLFGITYIHGVEVLFPGNGVTQVSSFYHSYLDPQYARVWESLGYRFDYGVVWSLMILSGLIAVGIRWLTLGKKSAEGE